MRQQWEYKTVKIDPTIKSVFSTKIVNPDGEFNKLGVEGWELVSILSNTVAGGKNGYQATFKRPIE